MAFFTCIRAGLLAAAVAICVQPGIAAAAEDGPITTERAKEIALLQTGGGKVVELALYRDGDGRQYYRLEIVGDNGSFHVELDEQSGRLLQFIQRTGRASSRQRIAEPSRVEPGRAASAVTREQALAIALAQTGGGTVIESDVEIKRNGRIVYEFEIINDGSKFEVDINGATGDVLKFKQKRSRRFIQPVAPSASAPVQPEQAASQPNMLSPRLSMEAAQALAKEKAGGGIVIEYKLDWENGRLVHEMEVDNAGTRYEIEIDDASGAVLDFSIER